MRGLTRARCIPAIQGSLRMNLSYRSIIPATLGLLMLSGPARADHWADTMRAVDREKAKVTATWNTMPGTPLEKCIVLNNQRISYSAPNRIQDKGTWIMLVIAPLCYDASENYARSALNSPLGSLNSCRQELNDAIPLGIAAENNVHEMEFAANNDMSESEHVKAIALTDDIKEHCTGSILKTAQEWHDTILASELKLIHDLNSH
jgi:hypothetical protein